MPIEPTREPAQLIHAIQQAKAKLRVRHFAVTHNSASESEAAGMRLTSHRPIARNPMSPARGGKGRLQ